MAKQINNLKRAGSDRIKCELVKQLLSFNFLIFHHFVTIFRNISALQDAIFSKAIELFQTFFHICFYLVTLFLLFLAITWNLNFTVNLVTSFSRQKLLKSEIKKTYDFLEYLQSLSSNEQKMQKYFQGCTFRRPICPPRLDEQCPYEFHAFLDRLS